MKRAVLLVHQFLIMLIFYLYWGKWGKLEIMARKEVWCIGGIDPQRDGRMISGLSHGI
jgi:hypothetical protein